MADLVPMMLSFPPETVVAPSEYDRQIRALISNLSNIPGSTFAKGAGAERDLLDVLNPAVNSIPYLYVLLAQIHSHGDRPKHLKHVADAVKPDSLLWARIAHFLEVFDPIQIRYVGQEYRRLLDFVALVASLCNSYLAGVIPIRSAMMRLDPMTGTFTSNHITFLRLCMQGRLYSETLPILDNEIHSFPAAPIPNIDGQFPCNDYLLSNGYITTRSNISEKLTSLDVQEYYVLGANAYLGLRNYKRAIQFLEHVLVYPTQNVATGLMVEAYRKWLVLCCLVEGRSLPIPRTANGAAVKSMRAVSKAYEGLVEAFASGSMPRLLSEMSAGEQLWRDVSLYPAHMRPDLKASANVIEKDGNAGLVQQLIPSLTLFTLRNLSKTYAALPFTKLAPMLNQSPVQAESYIQTLIDAGQLAASISSPSPDPPAVLRFHGDTETRSEEELYEELAKQTERTNRVAEWVRQADLRLSLSKEYVEFMRRKKREGKEGSEPMDTTWPDQDEDMMADL
ncbi:hypothetical protein M501DRAFT_1020231 [Patellaria atrata CBS 101060]|uniref:COP9 signalosome complex subunit 3 n=1 Tax=Patellaria atrata CBS 101060 TaxID=1346257 RepID=A0A9P4VL01_9PEZI|nr:hypothetical protein M501DRAFT_1020231 [Patellaria atrata CBS 101060]